MKSTQSCGPISIGYASVSERGLKTYWDDLFPTVRSACCQASKIFIFDGDDQTDDKPSSRAHFDMQWMHAMPRYRPEETSFFHITYRGAIGWFLVGYLADAL